MRKLRWWVGVGAPLLVLVATSARALAAEGGGEGEGAGSWLNWLYRVRVEGHPVVTTGADLAMAWAALLALALIVLSVVGSRRFSVRPGPFQVLLETALGALRTTVDGVMGPRGEEFLPFIGSIFLYVFLMNLMGVVPGFMSPTANLSITAALAVVIFVVVQIYGFKEHGVGYLKHFLAGLPPQPTFWIMAPLIFAIHIIGEFVRPVSLALRLFGNISGEETVVLTLVTLVAASRYFFWVPVQLPNLALGLLTAFVQALVMSLLAAVYLSGVVHSETEAAH